MNFPTNPKELDQTLDAMQKQGFSKNQMKAIYDQYVKNENASSASPIGRATQFISQNGENLTDLTKEKLSAVQTQLGTDTATTQQGADTSTFLDRASSLGSKILGVGTDKKADVTPSMGEVLSGTPQESISVSKDGLNVNPLAPIQNTIQAGVEGAKKLGTGLLQSGFSGATGTVAGGGIKEESVPKEKYMGEGLTNTVSGALQTAFAPISGALSSVPGGEKIAGLLSKPREGIGWLYEQGLKAAGLDPSLPEFQGAKEQLMTAFDLGSMVLPGTETGKKIIGKTVDVAKSALETAIKPVSYLTKEGLVKMSGLSEDTIKTIVENPEKFKTMKDMGVDASKQNLFENVKTSIDSTLESLSDTGKAYDTIRASTTPAVVPAEYWTSIADDLKIKPQVDSAGNLVGFVADSQSKLRSASELSKLADTLKPYWNKTELMPNEFLNYRTDLKDLAKYDSTKSTGLMSTAKDIRYNANDMIGKSIDGLRDLDAQYASQIEYANKVKDLIYDKKGNLKDNALSTLANLTGKGKELKLERLEEIMPDVASDVKAIKALENVIISAQNPVGLYGRGAATGIAFIKALSGDLSALPVAVGLAMTHPAIVSEFFRMYGEAKLKLSAAEVATIADKISAGEVLTAKEAAAAGELLSKLTTADLVPILSGIGSANPSSEAQQ